MVSPHLPQVAEVCILSTARICEVSAGYRGGPASYVCSVRGLPAPDGDPAMHLLTVAPPPSTAPVLQLKMLSLAENTRWRVAGLGFRRAAALHPEVQRVSRPPVMPLEWGWSKPCISHVLKAAQQDSTGMAGRNSSRRGG